MKGVKTLSTQEKMNIVDELHHGVSRSDIVKKYNIDRRIIDNALDIQRGFDCGNLVYSEFKSDVLSGKLLISETDIRKLRYLSRQDTKEVIKSLKNGERLIAHQVIKKATKNQVAKQTFVEEPKPRNSSDIFDSLLSGILSSLDDQLNAWVCKQKLSKRDAKVALLAIQKGKTILQKYEKYIEEEFNHEER